MKFMKKKEEVEEREKQEKQLIKELQQGNWSQPVSTETKSIVDGSRQVVVSYGEKKVTWVRENKDLYSVLPGRRSFNGCNRAIEHYYQSLIDDKYQEAMKKKQNQSKGANEGEADDSENDVDYDQLVSLPRGPKQGKRVLAIRDERTLNKRPKIENSVSVGQKLSGNTKKLQYELIRKKEIRKNIEEKKKSKVWAS